MDHYRLIAKWDYTYDKEGTWFHKESGENVYALVEGVSYLLPNIGKKKHGDPLGDRRGRRCQS